MLLIQMEVPLALKLQPQFQTQIQMALTTCLSIQANILKMTSSVLPKPIRPLLQLLLCIQRHLSSVLVYSSENPHLLSICYKKMRSKRRFNTAPP